MDRTANLLGTLSLVIADQTSHAVSRGSDQSETAAAALSALHQFLDRPSIDALRRVLGLTSSGTVRLVDRLEAAGLVAREREPGGDGRATVVTLTDAGHRAGARVAAARGAVLEGALAALSARERGQLERLAARLLAGLVDGPDEINWMCRLCDPQACGHWEGRCPVTNAAYGTSP